MRTADMWFTEYGVSHQNPTNKAIHWLCVPAILFAVIGLAWAIPTPAAFDGILPGAWEPLANFGTLLVIFGTLFYLRMSPMIALGMVAICGACLWGNLIIHESATMDTLTVNASLFVVAWVFQFIGHKIEGQKPSFFQDLQFLMIGPAWLLHFVYKKLGVPY